MAQSITELERDIEESRARLDLTIDRIQDKLSVSGMVDDVLGQARRSRYAPLYDNAVELVRRNPVPVMLIAAGIGWILYRASQQRPIVESVPFRPYDDAEMPVVSRGQSRVYPAAAAPLAPGPRPYDEAGVLADPYETRQDPLVPLAAASLGPRA